MYHRVSDVTAIWNTNAFFAYIMTVKLFHLKWAPRRLMAVCLATLGVLAVVYGGSTAPSPPTPEPEAQTTTRTRPQAPLIGDMLTLVASVGYGLYQVLYKLHAALPNDPELTAEYDRDLYSQLPNDPSAGAEEDPLSLSTEDLVTPPPFGLHPNLLTSCIGITTLLVLWIPIPFLHWIDIEPFMLPKDWTTVFAIAGIALSGVLYNAGFMVSPFLGPIVVQDAYLLRLYRYYSGSGDPYLYLWGIC
jgi:drug/metabolite transporter (DMT)-like permease